MRATLSVILLTLAADLCRAEPIHEAAKAGDVETVKKLITETPFLRKATDAGGQTPAMVAASYGQVKVVEYLLGSGIGVNETTANKRTLLHAACEGGRVDMIKLLVTRYRADVQAKDDNGWQPVHIAARKDPVAMLQFLLEQRADPNAAAKNGVTPLFLATERKLQPQVQLLLQKKADPNKANMELRTPLHVAAKNKDKVLVELLLKAGAKNGAKDKDGKTALDEATAAGATDIVPLLEKAGGPAAGKRSKNKP